MDRAAARPFPSWNQPLPDPGRVDFYVLTGPQTTARLAFVCRLTEKAYRLDHRVHVQAGSPAQAAELDELLWTFRQGSFVPHEVIQPGQPVHAPVTIGLEEPPEADVLINLTDHIPPFEGRFARVVEIVDESADGRQLARERYRGYQQLGRETTTHRIGEP